MLILKLQHSFKDKLEMYFNYLPVCTQSILPICNVNASKDPVGCAIVGGGSAVKEGAHAIGSIPQHWLVPEWAASHNAEGALKEANNLQRLSVKLKGQS